MINIDKSKLKRATKPDAETEKKEPPPVSSGAVDKVIDVVFNASRDKIREVTSIDRTQGRLLPQLDAIALMWNYVIEVAAYRQDPKKYKIEYERTMPVPPNIMEEYEYRLAQWQKSVGGVNMRSAIDIALAEKEGETSDKDMFSGNGFDDE